MEHQQRLQRLDSLTLVIDALADTFGVTWHAAALRAVSLQLITIQDLDDIKDLARQEYVAQVLARP